MKLHHFFTNFNISQNFLRLEDDEIRHQIKDVLKLRIGEQLILLDGQGNEALGVIDSWDKKYVAIKILETKKNNNEPKINTTLYCAILKKENFELVTQKAVEVGVKKIVPIITQRTIKTNLNQSRLEKIVKESAEQSERGVLSVIHPAITFTEAIADAKNHDLIYFFNKTGEEIEFKHSKMINSTAIFIGPEGGWTDAEIAMARANNFKLTSLGNLTLRGETAAIVASYLITNMVK